MMNTQSNIQSKSFQNYIRARERVESTAKEFVEKLNNNALSKVKNQKLAEKAAKEDAAYQAAKREKIHEKQTKYRQRK